MHTRNPRLRLFALFALLVAILPWLATATRAELTLHPLFSDGAILQRGQPVPVWGDATPGAKVDVAFAGQVASATADASGRWRANLAPLAASADSRELHVRSSSPADKSPLTIRDILVGDVWLASGQSNMDSPMSSGSAAQHLAGANDPLIRFFKTAKATAAEPQFAPKGKWTLSTPTSTRELTAVGYFFAREIRQSQKVPVAILQAAWGGTPIKTWMPLASLEAPPTHPAVQPLLNEWQSALAKHLANRDKPELLQAYYADRKDWEETVDKPFRAARSAHPAAVAAARAAGEPPPPAPTHSRPRPESPDPTAMPAPATSDRPSAPTVCYNAMVAPFAPFAHRGVLWYQGEADASRGLGYRELLARLITGWRRAWGQGEIPFLIVQLPGHGKDTEPVATQATNIAWLREAQDLAARNLPAVGLAVTSDLGDAADVHPDNKLETGLRLALLARETVYREPGLVGTGPRYASHEISGPAIRIRFTNTGSGLAPAAAPWVAKSGTPFPADRLVGFFVAGADRKWAAAEARIEGDAVLVSASSVPAPVAVRYAWASTPMANLYNREGLPATPFRTDDWDR
jgi:sialate O-acetylesterase